MLRYIEMLFHLLYKPRAQELLATTYAVAVELGRSTQKIIKNKPEKQKARLNLALPDALHNFSRFDR
jgi:hypothetical protein